MFDCRWFTWLDAGRMIDISWGAEVEAIRARIRHWHAVGLVTLRTRTATESLNALHCMASTELQLLLCCR